MTLTLAACIAIGAAGAGWFVQQAADSTGQADVIIIHQGDARFGPDLPAHVSVALADGEELSGDEWQCRWVLAHTDVGFRPTTPNGCLAQVYIDAERTRLVRFEYDEWMSLNVFVERNGERVGFADTRLKFVQ